MSTLDNDLNQHLADEAAEDERQARIEALAEQYASDPKRVAEADEWLEGSLPEGCYTGIESMLANIGAHGLTDDLLKNLLCRAKLAAEARAERIFWLAERDA